MPTEVARLRLRTFGLGIGIVMQDSQLARSNSSGRPRLTPEDEAIVCSELPIKIGAISLRREVDEAHGGECAAQGREIAVAMKFDFGPVVQPGAAHRAVVEAKASRADNMQRHARRRAQTRDVPSVRRYLRLDEDDADHKE